MAPMLRNILYIGAAVTMTSVATGCSSPSATDAISAAPLAGPPSQGTIGFFAVGDTGYISSKSGLSIVANAVREYCATESCEFGLMAGDNIYNDGAAGDDGDAELFRTRFAEPYGRLAQIGDDFRIYVALGNHDWYTSRVGALAQVSYHEKTPPFHMEGLFYSVKPPAHGGDVEIFVIDTEMLLSSHVLPEFEEDSGGAMVATGKSGPGGDKNALPMTDNERAQLRWFENALKNSTAKWKIVLAHHPLWQSRSDWKYPQSIKLRELLLPTLCRYADAYIAGHQHTQELHTDSCTGSAPVGQVEPLLHVVTGAGAKKREIHPNFQKWQQKHYPQLNSIWTTGDQWGFTHFSIAGEKLKVRMLNVAEDGSVSTGFTHSFGNRP